MEKISPGRRGEIARNATVARLAKTQRKRFPLGGVLA
jgi:hypothetical protein